MTRLRFTNDFVWVDDDEEEIEKGREFIVVDRERVLQKWGPDQTPLETRWLDPKEPWPDIEALNNNTPKKEWREGADGKQQGPWQAQWIIRLLDVRSMDKLTYPTSTTGGHMAVGDLSGRVKTMRRLRGGQVYPIVTLSDVHMKTKFGGRQRPHFEIVRWVYLGDDGNALPVAEKPRPQLQAGPAEHVVEEPSTKEIMNDKVRFSIPRARGCCAASRLFVWMKRMKRNTTPWYSPAVQRAAERAALERQADELLAADRRRQRKASKPPREPISPAPPSKWIKLTDLKHALRKRAAPLAE